MQYNTNRYLQVQRQLQKHLNKFKIGSKSKDQQNKVPKLKRLHGRYT